MSTDRIHCVPCSSLAETYSCNSARYVQERDDVKRRIGLRLKSQCDFRHWAIQGEGSRGCGWLHQTSETRLYFRLPTNVWHSLNYDLYVNPVIWMIDFNLNRGGATVLKVGGGQIVRAKRAENFFDPPLFGRWGGTKYCLDS